MIEVQMTKTTRFEHLRIGILNLFRILTLGFRDSCCSKQVREKLITEAPVNGGRNYDGPKVAKFLVG